MVIWYIDEDADDLFVYRKELCNITEGKIEIKAEKPLPSKIEMAELVLAKSETVAVIIDQRLGDAKDGVGYNGLDLAREIRQLNDKIPIYILTNHSSDLTSDEWEIDYVFSKDDFKDKRETLSRRLNRHINIFNEILNEREKRFAELLKKSVYETLTEAECKEFDLLDHSRSKAIFAEEAAVTAVLKERLDQQEKLLDEIKKKLE